MTGIEQSASLRVDCLMVVYQLQEVWDKPNSLAGDYSSVQAGGDQGGDQTGP
jgi:hypothetical protein